MSTKDSMQRTARIAGALYFLMGLTGAFHLLYAPTQLVVRGDAAATAGRIAASEPMLRVAIVSGLASGVLFVFAALTLYKLLERVDAHRAALMATLLLVAVPLGFVNALNLVGALLAAQGAPFLSVFTRPQLDALAALFLSLWSHGNFAAEIFWGLWLIPLGSLVYRSRFLPRALGTLLVLAGFAYVAHSLALFLLPGSLPAVFVGATTAVEGLGEASFVFWLLVRGVGERSAAYLSQ